MLRCPTPRIKAYHCLAHTMFGEENAKEMSIIPGRLEIRHLLQATKDANRTSLFSVGTKEQKFSRKKKTFFRQTNLKPGHGCGHDCNYAICVSPETGDVAPSGKRCLANYLRDFHFRFCGSFTFPSYVSWWTQRRKRCAEAFAPDVCFVGQGTSCRTHSRLGGGVCASVCVCVCVCVFSLCAFVCTHAEQNLSASEAES